MPYNAKPDFSSVSHKILKYTNKCSAGQIKTPAFPLFHVPAQSSSQKSSPINRIVMAMTTKGTAGRVLPSVPGS